jgi:transcription elongation factor GreA
MTPEGKERLRRELDRLRKERPLISLQIEEARAHGDLRENAEYHAAKEKQGMVEAKMKEIEAKLALAQVIDPARLSGTRVSFGATVVLLDQDTDEEIRYAIVGEDEANFQLGLISLKSPIARGILGREEGDEVKIDTGSVQRSFEIVRVTFEAIDLGPED